jgi:hypothetical protein
MNRRRPIFAALLLLITMAQVACGDYLTDGPPVSEPGHDGAIRAFCWSSPPTDCTLLTKMIWVRKGTTPEAAARQSLSKPTGSAAVFLLEMVRDLPKYQQDRCRTPGGQPTRFAGPWMDHGIKAMRARTESFFTRYKAAGGRMDLLVLDYEEGFTMWHLKPDHLRAIWNDPRFQPIAQAYGLGDIQKVTDWRHHDDYLTWNAVAHRMLSDALNRCLFDPAATFYPEAKSTNYGGFELSKELAVPDSNGHLQYTLTHCGTHGSAPFYGQIGSLKHKRLGGNKAFGTSPFAAVLWSTNRIRAIRRSSDTLFYPWVSYKKFPLSVLRDNPYYEEMIYHLALSGVDGFLYWNPRVWKAGRDGADNGQDRLLDRCLGEVNEMTGGGGLECVSLEPISWTAKVVATGQRVTGGGTVWRITVQPGVRRVRVLPDGPVIDLDEEVGAWYPAPPGAAPEFVAMD